MLDRPTLITCAITGNITKPEQTPYLPVTPEQIANSALEAAEAGAAVAHIHVRHPNGKPSMELEHYAETIDLIKKHNKELIINHLCRWSIKPAGTLGWNKAEVMVGGVDTKALDGKTMMVKKYPGLFFIGECVDVTGHLGGHNFQWAWSSAYVCANSLIETQS